MAQHSARPSVKERPPLLNRGIYDAVEVARLVHTTPETISRWASKQASKPAIVDPLRGKLFTFPDLISLYVVHELRLRQVPLDEIRSARRTLADALHTPWPFAHRELATAGRALFAQLPGAKDWIDAGKGAQGAFQPMVVPFLRPIEYGGDDLAAIWFPLDGIWVNPRVQAGAPCIKDTRVPTAVIQSLLDQGEDAEDIADDLDLELAQVLAAHEFEASLPAS
ncbi:MAG: DUF433 domain-containing protein [Acidimicrobiia bacterium]